MVDEERDLRRAALLLRLSLADQRRRSPRRVPVRPVRRSTGERAPAGPLDPGEVALAAVDR